MNAQMQQLEQVILTFGKHKGQTLTDVCNQGEYEYLRYIASQAHTYKKHTECLKSIVQFVSLKEEEIRPFREIFQKKVIELCKPIVTCLKFLHIQRSFNGKMISNFLASMQQQLENGVVPRSVNAREIIIDQAAKSKGRRNSKIYKDSYNRFNNILADITLAEEHFLIHTRVINKKENEQTS